MHQGHRRLAAAVLCAALSSSAIVAASDDVGSERFRVKYRDRYVSYVERNGLAMMEGDIVLGTAAELAALRSAKVPPKALVVDDPQLLWPVGAAGVHVVPYVYEAGTAANINAAVAQFNATFAGIIEWVPRGTETDYVAFNLVGPAGSCFSNVGRSGGRQVIGGVPTCSVGALLHEMGHAIGFWHTQSDTAATSYLDIRYATMDPRWYDQYAGQNDARQIAGFDYASIMHYGPIVQSQMPDPLTMATKPFGIDIGLRAGYSDGDIDAIKRLYGSVPTAVTVTSNPPGLELIIDGVARATPVTLNWRLGSLHRLDVADGVQAQGGARFAFGRWSHDPREAPTAALEYIVEPGTGRSTDPLTSPRTTVLIANFIRLLPLTSSVSGGENGTITVTPDVPPWPGSDNWYPQYTKLSFAAQIAPGFQHSWLLSPSFFTVSGGGGGVESGERRMTSFGPVLAGGTIFGGSAIVVQTAGSGVDGSVRANVTSPVASSAVSTLLPNVLHAASSGAYTIVVDDTQARSDSVRFKLQQIEGLDDQATGSVALPQPGEPARIVTINLQKQYQAFIERHPPCGGSVAVSGGQWIPHGTSVTATASMLPSGVAFAGWGGTMTGTTPVSNAMTADRVPHAIAYFNTVAEPLRVTGVSPPTFTLGEGPRTFQFTGSGFTTATTATTPSGAHRAGTRVDAQTFDVVLSDVDFVRAGKAVLTLANALTPTCDVVSDEVALDVLPHITPQLVTVHEFYNAALDRYFRTASDAEAAAIRANPATGETDTGQPFTAWSGVAFPAGARPVFRFYGSVSPGPNSHFFTVDVDEARALQRAELDTAATFKRWNYEELSFAVRPAANGACPADAPVRIYRVYNNGFALGKDSNHRLLTDFGRYSQMLASGWIGEGVVMCGPA